jgi:drug/metabolite transporter (DMT)-like permease
MIAFAANSWLCRMALAPGLVDAATFASLRMVSGAVTLALILWLRPKTASATRGDWRAAAMLFVYMVAFAFAYLSLSAGTGALILFGAVQLTMFVAALRGGENFPLVSWLGLALAVAGLVYLVLPGVTAPDPVGAVLMAVAGVAWGFYSLLGRGTADPLAATAWAFIYSVPAVALVSLISIGAFHASTDDIALAVASGAITSGCGYVVWYAALRGLTAASAAIVQLSVPVIAALGGALFLAEDVSLRLLIASAATLGGITIILMQRAIATKRQP